MKRFVISMIIVCMLVSNAAIAVYADDVSVATEAVVEETVIEDLTDGDLENISDADEKSDITSEESGELSADKTDEEIADEANLDAAEKISENKDADNENTSDESIEAEIAYNDEKEASPENADTDKDKDNSDKVSQREQRIEGKDKQATDTKKTDKLPDKSCTDAGGLKKDNISVSDAAENYSKNVPIADTDSDTDQKDKTKSDVTNKRDEAIEMYTQNFGGTIEKNTEILKNKTVREINDLIWQGSSGNTEKEGMKKSNKGKKLHKSEKMMKQLSKNQKRKNKNLYQVIAVKGLKIFPKMLY